MKKGQKGQKVQLRQICSWENYNLKGCYEGSCIFLQILNNAKDKIKMYEMHTDLTKYEKNLFQNAEQLFQYISHPQNMIINTQKNIFTVVGTHPIKKSEFFQLLKFNMQEIKPVKDNFKFLQLLSLCQDTNFDIQKGANLRYIICQLIKQINFIAQTNVPVEIERVMSKINYLGNQMSGIQFKTTDLLDKYYEISNRTTKIEEQVNRIKEKTQKNFQAKSLQTKYFMKKFMNQFRIVDQQLKSFQKFVGFNRYRYLIQQIEGEEQERNYKEIKERITNQVDKSADFFKHFKIKCKNISKVEDIIFPTMLIGSNSLIKRQEFKIIIRQKGTLHNIYPGVCVGIVDSKHKHKQSCDNNDNVIEYSCAGKLFEGNKYMLTEGNGFQNGDYVHVKVNFQQGTIIWMINDKQSCKHTSKNIINKEIDWRPYVFMRDKGDSIEWVLQE